MATEPSDMLEDHKGRLVPRKLVRPVDLARDEIVRELVAKAQRMSRALGTFKRDIAQEFEAFVALSMEEYSVKLGRTKGNVTLMSYDGRYKVVRQMADRLTFDERLQGAKELIDLCIREWAAESGDKVRALIEHAFQVDKQGRISVDGVLSLRKLAIEDERWQRAMRAITESTQVVSSKAYFRFYERIGETDMYRSISLDLASVDEVAP